MTQVCFEDDPVILAMQTGNIMNTHAAIMRSELDCDHLQAYIRFAIKRADTFVLSQLLNRIPSDRFSSDFVSSPVVSDIIREACNTYQESLEKQPAAKAASLQVVGLLTAQIDHQRKLCFSVPQLNSNFKYSGVSEADLVLVQKRARYHRVIYWAESLSLAVGSDAKFKEIPAEQARLKRVLSAFVSEMNNYITLVSDADLRNETPYQTRISAIEKFMHTVDKAYSNQIPTVFVSTVQESLALARATINNENSNQGAIAWFISLTTYGASRCSSALTKVEATFNTKGANAESFTTTCRQEEKATVTDRGNLRLRGY